MPPSKTLASLTSYLLKVDYKALLSESEAQDLSADLLSQRQVLVLRFTGFRLYLVKLKHKNCSQTF